LRFAPDSPLEGDGFELVVPRCVVGGRLADAIAESAASSRLRRATALGRCCACELRSPAQFTDAGFVAFNRHYVERLAAWGIFREEVNPVARSNVCPEIDPPTTPSFYAFSYTVPSESRAARSFVAAGSGETREGGPSYEGRIIRPGDHSPKAMREKANFVLGAMEQRMTALGFSWADVTATQVYTIFEIHPLLADEFVRRGAMSGALVWHFARPPVQGLDFEVDVRRVACELVI
jgi:hypothetical protein